MSIVINPDSTMAVHSQTAELMLSVDSPVEDRVAVIGRKGHQIHRTLEGIEVLGPRHFGFDLDYVPIEDRVKESKV